MINIEQEKQIKQKSPLEKMAPLVLIAFIIFAGFFVFKTFFADNDLNIENQINNHEVEQRKIEELINFINSEKFTGLRFTPDPSIFDQVTN
jgi:hypothetical protein